MKKSITIIGGGIFGVSIYIKLKEAGHDCMLLEEKKKLLSGATTNNLNRIHHGFHYPRDKKTALQSIKGYKSFKKFYNKSIIKNFPNFYLIANKSKVNLEQYIKFCQDCKLKFEKLNLKKFPLLTKNIEGGIKVQEPIYDWEKLKREVDRKINKLNKNKKQKMLDNLSPISLVIFLSLSGIMLRSSLLLVGQNWARTYHFLGTFILLPNIAYIITTVIAGDIALSLGMIGALSIVRFRHPVRSNFELTIYFALLTLGISAGVSIKLAILLLSIVLATILGMEITQRLMKYFNYELYQISFNEGIANNVLEISTNKKDSEIQENVNLVESFYSKSDKQFMFKLVFKNKSDLNNFLKNVADKDSTITYKTSSIIN